MGIRCCLIGGSGFIGSSLIPSLLESGREVIVTGRKISNDLMFSNGVNYLFGDLADEKFLRGLLSKVDEVIYLAHTWMPQQNQLIKTIEKNELTINLNNALNFFEIASYSNIKKIILISSGGAVYGNVNTPVISEDHSTNPISSYGILKLTIEKYAALFFKLKKLPIVIARPSNVYGINQKPFTGQGFIATAIASIIKEEEIYIYGEKGSVRDYIYADDLSDALLLMLSDGSPGEIYNIGTGLGFNNMDILNLIKNNSILNKSEFKIKLLPSRNCDVLSNILDCEKFKKCSGWEPKVNIHEGLNNVIKNFASTLKVNTY
jgi:UDP-glucose 4-epimerase